MSRTIIPVAWQPDRDPSPQTFQLPFGVKVIDVWYYPETAVLTVSFEGNPQAEHVGVPLWALRSSEEIPGMLVHAGSDYGWHVYMGRRE